MSGKLELQRLEDMCQGWEDGCLRVGGKYICGVGSLEEHWFLQI